MYKMHTLFDPYNPRDYTKFASPISRRFRLNREKATITGSQTNEFCERWEQMICQLNYNYCWV